MAKLLRSVTYTVVSDSSNSDVYAKYEDTANASTGTSLLYYDRQLFPLAAGASKDVFPATYTVTNKLEVVVRLLYPGGYTIANKAFQFNLDAVGLKNAVSGLHVAAATSCVIKNTQADSINVEVIMFERSA